MTVAAKRPIGKAALRYQHRLKKRRLEEKLVRTFVDGVRESMAEIPKRSDCIVTDASGKPIAVIDGVTRERRAV